MAPRVKDILERLDTEMAGLSRNETKELWDILTALRGPDEPKPPGQGDWKEATTCLIRYAALPKTMRGDRPGAFWTNQDYPDDVEVRKQMRLCHFQGHAFEAFKALGLLWHSVNVIDEPKPVTERESESC